LDPDDVKCLSDPDYCCLCLGGQDGVDDLNHPIVADDIGGNNFCTTINKNYTIATADQEGLSLECIYCSESHDIRGHQFPVHYMIEQHLLQVIPLGVLEKGIDRSHRELLESIVRGGKDREGTGTTQVAIQV